MLRFFRRGRKKPQQDSTTHLKKRTITISVSKRRKFLISVAFVSIALFITQFQFTSYGLLLWVMLGFLSDILLYWSIRKDLPRIRDSFFPYSVFILPLFFTIAFGFFYYLVPTRILSRLILTVIYAVGLYSLYLSQNIFTIGYGKTIQLLTGARIVTFVITLITFFLLTNVLYSLHYNILFIIPVLFIYTFLLVFQSVYSHAMQSNSLDLTPIWSFIVSICILQISILIWFWPSSPTIIALFLTGFLYIMLGLSHVWFDRKLFRGVIWEYVWIGTILFLVLVSTTSWGSS